MQSLMKSVQDPAHRNQMEEAMRNLKEDPELKSVVEDLEQQGPMAMMK